LIKRLFCRFFEIGLLQIWGGTIIITARQPPPRPHFSGPPNERSLYRSLYKRTAWMDIQYWMDWQCVVLFGYQ